MRRALPRHRLHGRLPRLHLGPRAVPGSAPASSRELRRARASSVVTIIDPGVKVDEDYDGLRRRAASTTSSARPARGAEYRNVVWPGLCAFPDFTNPPTRASGGATLHAVLLDAGVAGVWCDMNEPTLFVPSASRRCPPDVVHPGGGRRAAARARSTTCTARSWRRPRARGCRALRPDAAAVRHLARRATPACSATRCTWTGDNSSWWEHLWMSMPQLQNLGLSGSRGSGVDVGGFFGRRDRRAAGALDRVRHLPAVLPQPLGAGHASRRSRGRSASRTRRSCREHAAAAACGCVPYLYTLFEECHRTGAPILRPLLFEYPGRSGDLHGRRPVPGRRRAARRADHAAGIEHRHVYLPAGTWVQWWTGERHRGPAHVLAHAPLGQPAIYARCNTPIPMWPVVQHTGEVPGSPHLEGVPGPRLGLWRPLRGRR